MAKLIRITTVPLSLKHLLPGQMRYMKEHGLQVIMASSDGPEVDFIKTFEQCPHQVIPMTRQITPLADLKSLWQLYRFFKKQRPDIVHSHTPKAGLLAMLAARFAGVPLRIHTVAGLRFMTVTGLKGRLLVFMEKVTGRAATHVWPNSFSMLHYLQQKQIVAAAKMEVIGQGSSNGIDLQRYNVGVLDENVITTIKTSVQYNPQLFYFVAVGRIVADKGINELVIAFETLYQQYPHIRLLLVGSFEDELDPVATATKETIQTHPGIVFTGWSNAVEYYMHLAHVLVHPSHREGFPNVLLQAGAMQCPVICSAIDGNIDIVDHEKTGYLFQPQNISSLFTAMQYAVTHPTQLKNFATALHEKVTQSFDQKKIHQLLLEKYEVLLKEGVRKG